MKDFWDERAREAAFFFVDNRLDYKDPDLEQFWTGGREALNVALSRVGAAIVADDQIVEIGCGVGRITRVLSERGNSVRAVDVSQVMLDEARKLNADLSNVEWILGDGTTLGGIESESADVCHSHVVFQHIPDPEITLGYISEIGRVLRAGGWAAFEISNTDAIHEPPTLSARIVHGARALMRRGPKGQAHPAWLGSKIELADLRAAAEAGDASVERVVGEGTQYCSVLLRKSAASE